MKVIDTALVIKSNSQSIHDNTKSVENSLSGASKMVMDLIKEFDSLSNDFVKVWSDVVSYTIT